MEHASHKSLRQTSLMPEGQKANRAEPAYRTGRRQTVATPEKLGAGTHRCGHE